jgi:catechol 2,3-dioxygenase-like lactoylglutathione lyase family enzyme
MMHFSRISHTTLVTPDVPRMVEYYTHILGLRLVAQDGSRAFLATRDGVLAVVLAPGDAPGCERLAFQVAVDTDLEAMRKELADIGVSSDIQGDSGPAVARQLVFKDPKGTLLEISPEVKLLDRGETESMISPVKLGHLAFNVLDVPKITEFYTKHLGFRVSDLRGDIFSFLRCGPDHHTVNFALTHTNTVKMHHFALEVRDWGAIGIACDYLGRNDIRLVWGPGRHLIGHNVYIYHRNPDGQIVELYCDLDQLKSEELGYFEPRPWHQDFPQRPKVWPMDTLSNYWGSGAPPGFGD